MFFNRSRQIQKLEREVESLYDKVSYLLRKEEGEALQAEAYKLGLTHWVFCEDCRFRCFQFDSPFYEAPMDIDSFKRRIVDPALAGKYREQQKKGRSK